MAVRLVTPTMNTRIAPPGSSPEQLQAQDSVQSIANTVRDVFKARASVLIVIGPDMHGPHVVNLAHFTNEPGEPVRQLELVHEMGSRPDELNEKARGLMWCWPAIAKAQR